MPQPTTAQRVYRAVSVGKRGSTSVAQTTGVVPTPHSTSKTEEPEICMKTPQ